MFMRNLLLILSLFVLVTGANADQTTDVSKAFENLTKKEYVHNPLWGALGLMGDYLTTAHTIGDFRYRETNIILGDHPSRKSLNILTFFEVSFHYFMNKTELKNNWNKYLIIVKTNAVVNNLYHINEVENTSR